MDKRLASLLGLCQKAGKLVSGETACEKALQGCTARLIIVSDDASANTKKKFINKSFYYKVPCCTAFTRDELSGAIGKSNRATLAIVEAGFAQRIEEMLKRTDGVEFSEQQGEE